MNKENSTLLYNTIGAIILAFLLVISFLVFIPTTMGDKLVGTKVKYESVEVKDMPNTIVSVDKLLKGKNEVARLYEAKKTNGYGSVEVFVALDDKGVILGIDSNVDQSIGKMESKKYVKQFKGSNISEPKVLDGVTAPTVSITLGTVDELLEDIALASGFVNIPEQTIYDKLFGEGHTKKSVEFTAYNTINAQQQVEVDKGLKGFVFTGEIEGVYNDDGDTGIINLNFILDENYNLIGYEELTYTNSPGNYKKRVFAYLDQLVSEKADLKQIENHIDIVADSTYSGNLVNEMLKDLSYVANNNEVVNIYEGLFGLGAYLEFQNITPTTNVTKHFVIKNNNAIAGHSYEVTGSSDNGVITLEVITDHEYKVLKVVTLSYGHSPTHQEFFDAVVLDIETNNYLVSDVSTNIPATTQATGSTNLLKDMFDGLSAFVDQGLSIYYDLFAEGHKRETQEIEVINTVVGLENVLEVNTLVGFVYISEATGVYVGTREGTIKINFILNTSNILIGYDFLVYTHSGEERPQHKAALITYLDSLVTAQADLTQIDTYLDLPVTGATNSGNLVKTMLQDLSDFIEENRELTPYEKAYGKGYVAETQTFTEFKTVIGLEEVKVNDVLVGYVYITEGVSVYNTTSNPDEERNIKFAVMLDLDYKLVGYDFVEYNHSGRTFKERIVTYLDGLVELNVDLLQIDNHIDVVAGSTNSGNLINSMLQDLSEFLNEGSN